VNKNYKTTDLSVEIIWGWWWCRPFACNPYFVFISSIHLWHMKVGC